MTQISKAGFNTLYADSAGTFADNTTRDISEGDMRQQGEDIKDSVLFILDHFIDEDSFVSDSATKAPSQQSVKAYVDSKSRRATVTVSSAQLLTLGSVPVTIVAAPGANKYINPISIVVSYNYGTVAYVFAGTESPTFFVGSSNAFYQISTSAINGAADFNRKLFEFSSGVTGVPITTNTALTLGTADNGDPTAATGDGDLDVVVYYTIEDVNT